MAVVNIWADAQLEAGKRSSSLLVGFGAPSLELAGTFEKGATDSNGSIYKFARLPANAVIQKFEIYNDGIAGFTDADIGIYEEDGVKVVNKNILADALDMSNAAGQSAPKDGLKDHPIDKVGQKLWELLGKLVGAKDEGYVLALTANVAGGNAGTVSWRLRYALASG